MKKFIIFTVIAVFTISAVSAQTRNERRRTNPQAPQTQTIEGTLKLERGQVAVQSGDSVYLIPVLTRYIGFINELKEDARVSVEGFLLRDIIYPVKVTLGGKSYDFAGANTGFGMMGMMNNFSNRRLPAPGIRQPSE